MNWFWERRREAAEEIQAHIDERMDELIEGGMSPNEALQQARREFGSVTLLTETSREVWGRLWWDRLIQDLCFAFRTLRRSPGFTAITLVSLALGIGSVTAVFSVIDSLVLRSLPVPEPNRLVSFKAVGRSIRTVFPLLFAGSTGGPIPAPTPLLIEGIYPFEYRRLQESRSFSGVAAWNRPLPYEIQDESSIDPTATVQVEQASFTAFLTLGIHPMLGRVFDERDATTDAAPVVIASYSFWQRHFGSDVAVVGRRIRLLRTAGATPVLTTIIGVLPREFESFESGLRSDLWLLVRPFENTATVCCVVARLRPETTLEQAKAELTAINEQMRVEWQEMLRNASTANLQAGLEPIRLQELQPLLAAQTIVMESGARLSSELWERFGLRLRILMAIVTLLLVSATINVAALLLARANSREKELATRLVLGGGQSRLIRQLLTESLLLGALGGAAGVFVAYGGIRLVLSSALIETRRNVAVGFDVRVFAFCIAVSLLTAILFGLVPSLKSTKRDLTPSLKAGPSNSGSMRSTWTINRVLIALQIALSMVLLVGTVLLFRTLDNLRTSDSGFDKTKTLAIGFYDLPETEPLLSRLKSVAGVQDVSVFQGAGLFSAGNESTVGFRIAGGKREQCYATMVDTQYFKTLGISFIAGRNFEIGDDPNRVTVISNSMAKRFWGDESPLGQRYDYAEDQRNGREVIGVVSDVDYHNVREQSLSACYMPLPGQPRNINFVLRTLGNPAYSITAVRNAVHEAVPRARVQYIETVDERAERTLFEERLLSHFTIISSLVALFVTCVGVFGSMSYGVAQRTSEFGIRMALGARIQDIVGMLMREMGVVIWAGIAVGAATSIAAVHPVGNLLFGVRYTDPLTIAIAALVLASVAATAGLVPALRAGRVDPIRTLRYE